jgi:hypothetical protein
VVFRSIAIVAALGVASVAAAQTVADPQVTGDALRQVRNFENAIRKGIETAGSQVGDRARAAVPDVQLRFEAQPYAQGLILPNGEGILVVVEVPGIEATSAMVYERMFSLRQQQAQGLQGVGNTSTPPTPPVAPPLEALLADPSKAYKEFTKQALVDAMLDSALTLPLKEGQSLTISAGTLNPNPQPLDPVLRRLYLTIKAEDLLALRQNKISRDEAKSRIVEKTY